MTKHNLDWKEKQLPANAQMKQWMVAQVLGFLPPILEVQMESLTFGFRLALRPTATPQLSWALGNKLPSYSLLLRYQSWKRRLGVPT